MSGKGMGGVPLPPQQATNTRQRQNTPEGIFKIVERE